MAAPDVDPTITTPRNPEFLGAHYHAGGRVYDILVRRQAFTLNNQVAPYRGYVQRWGLRLPLIDIKGQLRTRLLSHQERNQQQEVFTVPVPQHPNVSHLVPPTTTLTVLNKVQPLRNILRVKVPDGVEVPIRWFFTIGDDPKVYTVGHPDSLLTTSFKANTDQGDFPLTVYPVLRRTVPANATINLWPSMRVLYNRILAINEATMDRQPATVYTVNFTEVLHG